MSGTKWTDKELSRLQIMAENKPAFVTDAELANRLVSQFGKSNEAIRWQLRQMRKDNARVRPPKILIIDIETLPIEALVWDVWKQNIYMEQIKKDWSVLCYSAKWLFDKKVMGNCVTPEEARNHEDYSLMREIWSLLNEANLVIWHNGNNFDGKKLNARFFQQGFPKPMYYQSIDTKKVATDTFGFTFNKLDWIAQILGIGRKIETDFTWWKECEAGNQKYLDLMLKYNKWDVQLEEEVYLKMRPWMDKHPNLAIFANQTGDACPACGSVNLHWNNTYATPLGLYQAFRCQDCGAIGRSTKKQYKLGASNTQN